MSFKNKLLDLRSQWEYQAREEAKRLAQEERDREREQYALEQAIKERLRDNNEHIVPILKLVNQILLDNKGEITNKEEEVSLSWGTQSTKYTASGYTILVLVQSMDGKTIIRVRGRGHGSPEFKINLDTRDAQNKLEQAIYHIVSNPNVCEWWEDWDPR